jgi:hypothetical protein
MNYSVDDVYKLVQYAMNKAQHGNLPPAKFNLIINQAQKSYSAYLLGSFTSYTPGRPVSKVELGQNSVVRTRLTPTIYSYNLNVDSTGFSQYPGDYLQTDGMWSIYGFNRIRYASQEKFYSIYGSVIDPIVSNPIYLLEDVGFRFYPQSIGNARLSYVRNPPDIIWGYVDDVNGRPVYSEASSSQPVWDDASLLEIIIRALSLVSVNLQMGVLNQYVEQVKREGQ